MTLASVDMERVASLVLDMIQKAEAVTADEKRRLILLDRATTVTEFMSRLGINIEVQRDGGGNLFCSKAYQVAIKFPSEVGNGK